MKFIISDGTLVEVFAPIFNGEIGKSFS